MAKRGYQITIVLPPLVTVVVPQSRSKQKLIVIRPNRDMVRSNAIYRSSQSLWRRGTLIEQKFRSIVFLQPAELIKSWRHCLNRLVRPTRWHRDDVHITRQPNHSQKSESIMDWCEITSFNRFGAEVLFDSQRRMRSTTAVYYTMFIIKNINTIN